MDMRKFVVRLPGRWEDAWLYREQLLVWNRSGELFHVPLDTLRGQVLQSSDHHHAVLAENLVFRSERKSAREVQDLLAVPGVSRSLFSPLMSEEEIVVQIDAPDLRPSAIEAVPGNLMDTVAYGNRIFSASDEGVYEAQFDARYDNDSPLLQVHSAPATSIVAGNGQFAVSLGEIGLIAREVTFGEGPNWIESAANAAMSRLAPFSRDVRRSSVHLINYGESAVPDFIRATTTTEYRETGFSEKVVTDYAEPLPLDDRLLDVIGGNISVEDVRAGEGFQVLGNANYRLLVQVGSEITVLNMLAPQRQTLRVSRHQKIDVGTLMASPFTRALSTQALRSGFLVEHPGGLHLLMESGILQLADELVVQARSFPSSRRYVDTVAVIREDSLDLIGFVDVDV